MAVTVERRGALTRAYGATGGAGRWQAGPGRIYDRLAVELVARCPGTVAGRRVLDLGAGAGAAGRAALASGAAGVVAVDLAVAMLTAPTDANPGVAADARALPFAARTFGAALAAFSLNHLADPVAGFTEAARVLVPGGGLAASAYAEDDTHPVKAVVEAVCVERGWSAETWYRHLRAEALPRLATVERAVEAAIAGGFEHVDAEVVRVEFPDLSPAQLVHWRLGMAQLASFVEHLPPADRHALAAEATARLGPTPPMLVRSFVVLTGRAPDGA